MKYIIRIMGLDDLPIESDSFEEVALMGASRAMQKLGNGVDTYQFYLIRDGILLYRGTVESWNT